MTNSMVMILAHIVVGQSTVSQMVKHFCVYFVKLKQFWVNLGQPVNQLPCRIVGLGMIRNVFITINIHKRS